MKQPLSCNYSLLIAPGAFEVGIGELAHSPEMLPADGLGMDRQLPAVMQYPGGLRLTTKFVVDKGLGGISLNIEHVELQLG